MRQPSDEVELLLKSWEAEFHPFGPAILLPTTAEALEAPPPDPYYSSI